MMIKQVINITVFTGGLFVNTSLLADTVPEIDCLIEPNMVIELSSSVAGVLDTISVDRSDTVKKGQILATLKSEVEQVKLKASQETLNLSKVEQKRSVDLYKDNAITLSEKEQSDHDVVLNELEVEHSLANLELRNIRSPIDGVVADRYLMPGEFIEENPILKLAQLDPLRIEVVAPVAYFGRVKTGMHAEVKTDFGSFDDLVAEVIVVDKVVDAASGTFGIRLELQNKDHQVPGGLKCSVRFFDEHEEAEYTNVLTSNNDIKLVVAPDLTETENQATICRRIGPFRRKDTVLELMNALTTKISSYQIQDETNTSLSYQVITQALESREAATALKAEIQQAGVKDIAISKRTAGFIVSLGLFSSEQSADNRQAAMKKLGYDSKVIVVEKIKLTYWVEVNTNKSDDELSERVSASGIKGTDNLLYQSCNAEILARRSLVLPKIDVIADKR